MRSGSRVSGRDPGSSVIQVMTKHVIIQTPLGAGFSSPTCKWVLVCVCVQELILDIGHLDGGVGIKTA